MALCCSNDYNILRRSPTLYTQDSAQETAPTQIFLNSKLFNWVKPCTNKKKSLHFSPLTHRKSSRFQCSSYYQSSGYTITSRIRLLFFAMDDPFERSISSRPSKKALTTSNHLRHVESLATLPSGAGRISKLNAVILGESLASEEDDLVFPSGDFSRQAHVPSPQKVCSVPYFPIHLIICFGCIDFGNYGPVFGYV